MAFASMATSPDRQRVGRARREATLKTYRLAAGYLYQARLRAELARTVGVEWQTPGQGAWPRSEASDARYCLSSRKRRAQIVHFMPARRAHGRVAGAG
jgi:hypothetical protein